MPPADDREDLLRRFEVAISGTKLTDLRRIASDLSDIAGLRQVGGSRPRLRRPPLAERVRYRVRADLDHARPPIWRRLDLRSDLTLTGVHEVLQTAFGWTDSHLHRFALGGGPFDEGSEWFLCPFDVEEGEDEGTPAAEVRLDETLQEPGDVLRYVYDYGDSWELVLRLEAVLPADDYAPRAVCVDGRRAAPPENCGGITDAESLAEILDDPAAFDLDEVNAALSHPLAALEDLGVDPRLVELLHRLRFTPAGDHLTTRSVTLALEPRRPDATAMAESLGAHRWFLDRAAAEGGIELTAAGYLRPSDVVAASAVVPTVADWIGANNREAHTAPLLGFRQSLQAMGLLRKHRGRLLLTRAGRAARDNPQVLWDHLAARLVPATGDDDFVVEATLLVLAYAATAPGDQVPLDRIAGALGELGWRGRGGPLQGYHLYRLPVLAALRNVTPPPFDRRTIDRISPQAAALAHAALRQAP